MMAWIHYFVSSAGWWIVELAADHNMAFGSVRLNADDEMAEWGYVDLRELRTVVVQPHGYRLVANRDLNWRPGTFNEVNRQRRRTTPSQTD